jgi:phage terminase large subunit-like protein
MAELPPGVDLEAFKRWTPRAQEQALEALRKMGHRTWRPFWCKNPQCSGEPHGEWRWNHARADQRPPTDTEWLVWLLLSGRGSGKTRTGSEYINRAVAVDSPRVAIIAGTAPDARDIMVEGESGIVTISKPDQRPAYEPSKRRLTWPNGAVGTIFSAEEPDRLRGPEHYCFVAGTMIETIGGPVPIEHVHVGDLVWTRDGLFPVAEARSRPAAVITRNFGKATLTGTPDHPIATRGGWVPLGDVRPDDKIIWWDESRTGIEDETDAGAVGQRPGNHRCCGRAGCGNATVVPSPTAGKSTISTTTTAMTASTTSPAFPPTTTKPSTDTNPTPSPAPSVSATSSCGADGASCATTVATTTGVPARHDPTPVGPWPSPGYAGGADKGSSPGRASTAPSPALTGHEQTRTVFNLTVAQAHEYVANGIVVHNCAWWDEPAHAPLVQECWDNLMFGLRLGRQPRVIATSTPKPRPWLKELVKEPTTRVARASTYANLANLAPAFAQRVIARYEGTRLGKQELHGEILEDVEGALWTFAMIEVDRVEDIPEPLVRIVVAIDPAGSSRSTANETAIIAVGRGESGHIYILRDRSGHYSPNGWATAAIELHDELSADAIVAEKNFGADMVASNMRMSGFTGRLVTVQARRGKELRAEPVVGLYEQHLVHHVGVFGDLEDQMASWVPYSGAASPDRLDALVYAVMFVSARADQATIASPVDADIIEGGHGRIPAPGYMRDLMGPAGRIGRGPVIDTGEAQPAVVRTVGNVPIVDTTPTRADQHLVVRIGGGLEAVTELLAGLPGSHVPEHIDHDDYVVATSNAGFLRFAITQQGYGEVLSASSAE